MKNSNLFDFHSSCGVSLANLYKRFRAINISHHSIASRPTSNHLNTSIHLEIFLFVSASIGMRDPIQLHSSLPPTLCMMNLLHSMLSMKVFHHLMLIKCKCFSSFGWLQPMPLHIVHFHCFGRIILIDVQKPSLVLVRAARVHPSDHSI